MNLKISEIMKRKGVSIETLKSSIKKNGKSLSRTSISNIINNKSIPKIDTLELIANALDVPMHHLFNVKTETIHLIIKYELVTFRSLEELKAYVMQLEAEM